MSRSRGYICVSIALLAILACSTLAAAQKTIGINVVFNRNINKTLLADLGQEPVGFAPHVGELAQGQQQEGPQGQKFGARFGVHQPGALLDFRSSAL